MTGKRTAEELPEIVRTDEWAPLVIRTDYTDDVAWREVVAELERVAGGREWESPVHLSTTGGGTGSRVMRLLPRRRGTRS